MAQEIQNALLARLEAGRRLHNACLGEARRRWNLVHQSRAYQEAGKMPRGTEEERKARAKAISEAWRTYGFFDYDLQMYALEIRHGWLEAHLDAFTAQKLATRAFAAQKRVALGQAGTRSNLPGAEGSSIPRPWVGVRRGESRSHAWRPWKAAG